MVNQRWQYGRLYIRTIEINSKLSRVAALDGPDGLKNLDAKPATTESLIVAAMNHRLVKEGWELVTVVNLGSQETWYLRRPEPQTPQS